KSSRPRPKNSSSRTTCMTALMIHAGTSRVSSTPPWAPARVRITGALAATATWIAMRDSLRGMIIDDNDAPGARLHYPFSIIDHQSSIDNSFARIDKPARAHPFDLVPYPAVGAPQPPVDPEGQDERRQHAAQQGHEQHLRPRVVLVRPRAGG